MPPIWGKKYLEDLGLESWEQVEKMAEQALQEKDRQWGAEAESRRNQNTAQLHTPVSQTLWLFADNLHSLFVFLSHEKLRTR